MSLHDWSITELYSPIWVQPGMCVCVEGIQVPKKAKEFIRLVQSESFGTGGHPATRAAMNAMRSVRSAHMGAEANVLDFCAGTGLLSFYQKTIAAGDRVVACPDPLDFETLRANEKLNGKLDEVVLPGLLISDQFAAYYARYFDMIVTQMCSRDMLSRLAFLEKICAPNGSIIFAGHTPGDHKVIAYRVAEYFELIEISDYLDWPAIIAQPITQTKRDA